MAIEVGISVPVEDREGLDKLARQLGATDGSFERRALDGATVVTVMTGLSVAAFPFFKTWVQAKVAEKKTYTINIDGRTLKGYTADDAIRILKTVEQAIEQRVDPLNSDD
ncbi:hypothetical protein ACFU44_23005 [Nocardia rhizosphaerihabitans]|uniref:hypothetical protein n=1 Tax=Nocardia rhizosphaerihabitans TaxID=1691570 RepID=UPI003671A20B